MISFIINFSNMNKKKSVFSKEYKDSYRKLWINNIRDYNP